MRSSVSGKTKLRQARCAHDCTGQLQAVPSAGASAGTDRVTPDCSNRIVISLTPGSAANASSSLCSVTTSPGLANGVVTDPSVDGNVRSLAGMRLHTACTDDDRATESASETRETDTYADLCIVTPIARERARSNASGALSHRGRRERNSKPSIRQQECPVMRSCKGSNAALRG